MIVDEHSIVLKTQFGIIANGRLDHLATILLLFGIRKSRQITTLDEFGSSGPFFRVKLEHSSNQLNRLRRSIWLEPLINRLLLGVIHLLHHRVGRV